MSASNRVDKTEDSQTKERAHGPRTTSGTVPLIPLPLRVAALVDMSASERERIIRTYTELHAIRNVCFLPFGQKVGGFDS